jgi:hypothetical protein
MQEITHQSVDRTLASIDSLLTSVTHRAEKLSDQALAEDLHNVLWEIKRVRAGISPRGAKYRPSKATVRN